jgi:MinD superfamily P-loop ATPase
MRTAVSRRSLLLLLPNRPVRDGSEDVSGRCVVEVVEELCAARAGFDCRACVDRCPLGAAALAAADRGPEVGSSCDGCGECILACSTTHDIAALRLKPKSQVTTHTRGEEHVV